MPHKRNPILTENLTGLARIVRSAVTPALDLYDPDRSQTLTWRGEIRTWSAFIGVMRSTMNAQRALQGAGLRILTGTVTSPTLGAQLQSILADLPQARWHQYEPANRDNPRNGSRIAFGAPLNAQWRFDKADVVLASFQAPEEAMIAVYVVEAAAGG